MLVVQLKKHFPARWPEWFMACVLATWGSYILLHPQIFVQESSRTALAGMASMVDGYPPASVWGIAALFTGMVRACALFVNGAYTRTPLIRLVMSFLSAFIWTQVFIGLTNSGVADIGLVVYAWLVVMDIASAYRAATDTVFAEKLRRDVKQELSRGHRRNSIA